MARRKLAQGLAKAASTYATVRGEFAANEEQGTGYHIWVTRGDQRVRPSHRRAAGEVRRTGKLFSTSCRYPRDPLGPIEEIAGCRCHTRPTLSPKGAAASAGGRGQGPPRRGGAGSGESGSPGGGPPGGGASSGGGRGSGRGSGSGRPPGGGRGPLGPDDPGGPNIAWFQQATFDREGKFDRYLLSPTHPIGRNKLRWLKGTFGFDVGDGTLFERLIREQLVKAEEITEKSSKRDKDDLKIMYRRWEIIIPAFEGPNKRQAPLLTSWALDPRRARAHFTNAYPADS